MAPTAKRITNTLLFLEACLDPASSSLLRPGEAEYIWALYLVAQGRTTSWYGHLLDQVSQHPCQ